MPISFYPGRSLCLLNGNQSPLSKMPISSGLASSGPSDSLLASILPFFGSQEFNSCKHSKPLNACSGSMGKAETAVLVMEWANLERDVVIDPSFWHKKHPAWHLEERVSWQVGR